LHIKAALQQDQLVLFYRVEMFFILKNIIVFVAFDKVAA